MTIARRQFVRGGLAATTALAAPFARAAAPGVSDTPLPRLFDNHRVIVDTDPGNDDAMALLMALSAPNLRIEAITVAPGNIRYAQEVKNALYVVDLARRSHDVPVHAGMTHPLLNRPYATATFIHGQDGLGKVSVPEVRQKVDPEHAVDAIRRIVRAYPGEVVIAALGSLTNLAMALLMEPGLAALIKGVVFVGGPGSSAIPSFNSMVDPEAAMVVLNSGVPLTMFGPAAIMGSTLVKADYDTVATFQTARSRFFADSNALRFTFETQARGAPGSINADPLAMALIIDPAVGMQFQAVAMRVELEGEYTRGTLLYGENRYSMAPNGAPNVNLCMAVDSARFKDLVFSALKIP